MGKVLIKYKIMPESPSKNLKELLESIKSKIEKEANFLNSEEQPIAFGLKSLIITISIDENKETTSLENNIKNTEGVSSLDVIDYRRAIE